jgi:Tfp pilus tip-associated adhesin PilY1
MKRIYFILTLTILLFSLQDVKSAFSADEPFYATLRPMPNVLIILDRSGSMNWIVTTDNVNGACTATAPDTTTTQANKSRVCIARDVLFDLLDDNGDGSITSPADDVSLGVRLGYMRYYQGNIQLRQNVGTPYDTIWGSTTTADARTLNVGGNTPLGQSLMDALAYFQTSSVILDDGCIACRKNFVIVVTDGADTATCGNTTARNRSVVYAARALKNGPDGIAGNDDDIPVFVIGLGGGLSAGLQNTLNWAAYYGYGGNDPNPAPNIDTGSFTPGTQLCDSGNVDPANETKSGYAFIATDAASLATSIKQAINLAKQGSYTRSAPVLTTAGIGGTDRIYQGFFDLGANINWQGHLLAWDIDATTGDLIDSAINNPCTSSLSTPNTGALRELYDAGRTLTYSTCGGYVAPADRKIYTVVSTSPNSSTKKFDAWGATNNNNNSTDQIALCNALNITGVNCNTDYLSNAVGSANELINFIRFVSPTFNGNSGARNNSWHLGDIWHSTPTIVGPPFGIINSTAYKAFKTNNANRTQILILGANDGMLHALDDTNKGKEMWSFIPNNLLGKLQNLSTGHSFFMDASPTAADVCLTANCGTADEAAADWETVVISGERDGGKAYFALRLDGTTTTTPYFKWEFTDACLGNTWSKPTIGKVRYSIGANTEDKWVTFFGGGVSSSAPNTPNCDDPNSSNGGNIGNYIYAVDIKDGTPLGSGPNATKKKVDNTITSNNVPSALRPVDLNGDYYVEAVYFGDTEGRMRRWDVSNLSDIDNGALNNFFDPGLAHYYINSTGNRVVESGIHNRRPIYYRPAITLDKNFRPVVVFGTGNIDELKATPPETTTIDFVYAIRQEIGYTGTETDQSGVTELWKVILNCQNSNPNTPCGERLIGPTMIFGGYVLFITYRPEATTNTCQENGSTVSCDPGSAWLYIVDLETGVIVNGNGHGEEIGPGIGSMTCSGDKCYTTTSNDTKITKHDIPDKSPNADVIYWRER